MADADTIRRREIRKRKILEQSEARLNRITNASKLLLFQTSIYFDIVEGITKLKLYRFKRT